MLNGIRDAEVLFIEGGSLRQLSIKSKYGTRKATSSVWQGRAGSGPSRRPHQRLRLTGAGTLHDPEGTGLGVQGEPRNVVLHHVAASVRDGRDLNRVTK